MRKTLGLTVLITALVALGSTASASSLAPGDFKNVSKFCKALKKEMGESAFAEAFDANPNKRNAHGKCVSKKGVLPEPADPGQIVEPPLPVSAFGTSPAPDDKHGKKKK